MGIYDDDIAEAYDDIVEAGADLLFVAGGGSQPVYDPVTDEWTNPGGTTTSVGGKAVQVAGDPDRYAALNLVLVNPVTLLVAAKNLTTKPKVGMQVAWAGELYTVRDVEPTAPDGTAIIYTVVGSQ